MTGARPDGRFRVLVLGGTGVFGSRFCRILAGDPEVCLTVAARDRGRVEAIAAEFGIAGISVDWQRTLDEVLGSGAYGAVAHLAGPFQGQGYDVAETCIRHRVHYLDLADDTAFVCGIDRLDAAAKAAGVIVCAGVSTAPALTGAVVEAAIRQGAIVERVAFGIAPGNDTPRGRAVVDAILSRAGKPIADQPGRHVWGSLRRMRMPGLGVRWLAACDLPEPALFARRFDVRDTYAGAGLELSLLHLGLWMLAGLVRIGLVRTLAPAAGWLAAAADRLRRFGTDRGGLRVDLDGPAGRKSWCLLAEGGDGPFVPVLPAVAFVRKLARGELATPGAMPCLGLLSLSEIEEEWRRAGLRIGAGWGEDGTRLEPSLYRRALGHNYDRLAAECQALHGNGSSTWDGRCTVDGPQTFASRLVSWLFQLPPAAHDTPITVEFTAREGRETWTRHVGGRSTRSRQYIGARKPAGSLVESFGPFAFDLAVTIAEGRLTLTMTGARFLGIALPRVMWPLIGASETGEGGRFIFDVEIGLPLIGRLVRYRGWLKGR